MNSKASAESQTYTSIDGLSLHYKDYVGKGRTTALCMHGLSRNARDFIGLAVDLQKKRHVICPDFRGRGESQWDSDTTRYDATVYVGDMIRLLDQLELERVLLIGTSLGGVVSAGLCQVIPDRIAGVVLNDIGPVIDPAGLARIAKYVGKEPSWSSWDDAVASIREINGVIYPDFTDDEWMEFARQTCREKEGGEVVQDYDPAIAQAFATEQAADLDLWPLFEVLTPFPCLLIRGGLSDLLSEKTAQTMVERLPNLVLVTVPNRGHVPTLTEPLSLSAIEAFADKVDTLEESNP